MVSHRIFCTLLKKSMRALHYFERNWRKVEKNGRSSDFYGIHFYVLFLRSLVLYGYLKNVVPAHIVNGRAL